VVEFEAPLRTWSQAGGGDRQDYYRVRVLDVIAGSPPEAEQIDFFPHAEGAPRFRAGERALLFLERTELRPEFASLAARFPWFSVQAAGEEWSLEGAEGAAVLDAARAWARWLAGADAGAPDHLRALLLRQLGSPVARLRRDALLELVRARDLPGVLDAPGDAAAFAALLAGGTLPVAERLTLLQLLEGRPGFDPNPVWEALFASQLEPREWSAVLRVAGRDDAPGLSARIGELLAAPDPALRRAAAEALADPRHAARVGALAKLAAGADDGAARAAIQALAAIATDEALQALRLTAQRGDPRRARWARAALRRAERSPAPGARRTGGPGP
jgi:hypothetical protein